MIAINFLHIRRLQHKLPKGTLAPECNNWELNISQQLSKAQLTGALTNQLQPLLISEGHWL